MGELLGTLLVLAFFGFLAFIAMAPKELRQIALAGMWGVQKKGPGLSTRALHAMPRRSQPNPA